MRGLLACLLAWHALLGCSVADEREARAPARPGRVRVRSGADAVALQWRPPAGGSAAGGAGHVRGYVLGYGEAGKRLDYVQLPQEARSHSIQPLAPESVYLLSLQSANAMGRSLPVYRAAQTKRVVSDMSRLYEPVDVSARVLSPKSVVITWKDPSYEKGYRPGSGSTRYYTVRYRERGESSAYEYQTASQLRATVEELEPATTYEFGVRVSQGERDGRWSSPHFQRTPESPPTSPPEDFEVNAVPGTPSSVSVLWSPPPETQGRVTEYTVSYTPALRPFSGKVVTFPGGVTRGTIEGLSPGERYIFRVRAANRRGQGPLSKPLSLVLPPTVSGIGSSSVDSEPSNERRSPTTPELPEARTPPRQASRSSSSPASSSSAEPSNERRSPTTPELPEARTPPRQASRISSSPASSSSSAAAAASSEVNRLPAEHISSQTSAEAARQSKRIIQSGQSTFPRRIGSRPGQTSSTSSSSSSRPWPGSSQPVANKPSTASSTESRFGSSLSTPPQPSSPQRAGSREYEMVDEPGSPPVASSSPRSRDIFPSFSETVSFSERTSDSREPSSLSSSQNSMSSSSSSSSSPSSRLSSARSSSNSVSASSHLPRTSASRFSSSLPSTSAAAATSVAAASRSASRTSESSASKIHRQPLTSTLLGPSANSRTSSSSSSAQTPALSPTYVRNNLPGEAANVRSSSSALQSSRVSSSSRSSPPSSSSSSASSAYLLEPVTSTNSETPRFAPPSSNSERFPKGSTSSQRSASSGGPSWERVTRPHSSSSLYSNERGDLSSPHEPHTSSSSSLARNPSRPLSPFASRTTGTSASRAAPSSASRQNPSHPSSALSSSSSSSSSALSQPARPQWQGSKSRFTGRPLTPSNPSTDTSNGRNYRPTSSDNRSPYNGRARPVQSMPDRPTDDTRRNNNMRVIQAPGGREWIVDLEKNILLTPNGQVLQDIRGKPLTVKIGNDGHSIEAEDGTPILSREGLPVFGYGRDGRPLMDSRGRPLFSPEGRPLLGLHLTFPALATTTTTPATTTTRRTTTRRTTTTTRRTTTTATTTTTAAPPPTTVDYALYEEEPTSAVTDSYDYELDAETTVMPLVVTTTTATAATTAAAAPPAAGGAFLCAGANGRGGADCGGEESSGEEPIGQSEDLPLVDEGGQTAGGSHLDHSPFRLYPESELDSAGRKRFTASHVRYLTKDTESPCSLSDALEHFQVKSLDDLLPQELAPAGPPGMPPRNLTVVAVEGCHSFVILGWTDAGKTTQSGYLIHSATLEDILQNKWETKSVVDMHAPIENLKANTRYYFKVQAKNTLGAGPATEQLSFVTESENPLLVVRAPGGEPIWVPFSFRFHAIDTECKGRQYVKRTRYRKFVGVILCNSLRYKIFLSDTLTGIYYGIGDEDGKGEDHCQFVDSYLEGKTGPRVPADTLPIIPGYYRRYRQQPVEFGQIGAGRYYVGWYECGISVPGNV